MKKKVNQKQNTNNGDIIEAVNSLGSKISVLDTRISRMESYMKEGFNSLDNKIENVDNRLSHQMEGLGRRIDDFAENKISRITYKELENRVLVLESKILPKAKK
jgi:DNA anti-recombination protein RmuC